MENYKNSMTYNSMTRILLNLAPSIAYIADFKNHNAFEEENITTLLAKARELNVRPVLFVPMANELLDGIWNKENLEQWAARISPELYIIFYVVNGLIQKTPDDRLVHNLQGQVNIEYFMVAANYTDITLPQITTSFIEQHWGPKALVVNNAARKPHNDELITYLRDGDFETFAAVSGQKYLFSGRVVDGEHYGRQIGYPTANIITDGHLKLSHGAYFCRVWVNQMPDPFFGMACYWINPKGQDTFETYLFDFDANIYGRCLTIEPIEKIHDVIKVNSIDEVKTILDNDKKTVLELISSYITE